MSRVVSSKMKEILQSPTPKSKMVDEATSEHMEDVGRQQKIFIRCVEAVPLDAWVPADDVIPVCKAVLEAYRDLGTRGHRQKTRMMWLINELGIEGFRAEVVKRMPQQDLERSSSEDLVHNQWERRDHLGVHPQKQ
ncbi:hypothetical protein LOK49_LG14G01808 [Camellia lanceoleosa]|uniref:Uncharacterized protein n=1 Tax=Camellia lanceoleosa TaxID=1840588 RepID=A0ACC0FFU0_9ERIC|nr:hypothetical protein LOK49_LG14G01808 [Camellia lanceoleosa]